MKCKTWALCGVSIAILSSLSTRAAAQTASASDRPIAVKSDSFKLAQVGAGSRGGRSGQGGGNAGGGAITPGGQGASSDGALVTEIVVTANKRSENINNVGISISAATGDQLAKVGVTDTSQLQKIVPGFVSTPTYFGTNVFTIRGVGFQDTSLAGSPTVSVYVDEVPLPFGALTNGATLDLERVEVLKGPQGTLFGENATGGAINYIAAKPTTTFHYGGDVSYATFSDVRVNAYVSGPITSTLSGRLALQSHTSDAWQRGYGPQSGLKFGGGADFQNGRASLLWKPTEQLRVLGTVSAWQDKSYNQVPQKYGIAELSPLAPLAPAILNYPNAPHDARAAGFNLCVNTDPYDPIAGQQFGSQWLTPGPGFRTTGVPNGQRESQGPGSVVQTGGQPTHCIQPRNDNSFVGTNLRVDYDLGHDMVATSLSSYQKFNRSAGIDGSGLPIQDYQSYQRGKINVAYQELRLAGKWPGSRGSWLVGGNYEYDKSWDNFLQTYNGSTASPTLFYYDQSPAAYAALAAGNPNSVSPLNFPGGAGVIAYALGPTRPTNRQQRNTYAVYASGEYPIFDNVTLLGGVRYTKALNHAGVCGNDGGDGSWANVGYALQMVQLEVFSGKTPAEAAALAKLSPAGSCASTGPKADNFNSPANGALFSERLDEDNLSWRAGVNYKLDLHKLLYVNISQGYKSGSFPTVALATFQQAIPVVQEGLLSYEAGFKFGLLDRQLQLNGAAFYYDYQDKQVLGAINDLLFGSLPALVNVPTSHVMGFELSAIYTPDFIRGLRISPSISYQDSEIDTSDRNVCDAGALAAHGVGTCKAGHFYGFDPFSQYADFTGQPFPSAPKFQATLDAEYDWQFRDNIRGFVGGTLTYTSDTTTFFVNPTPLQPVGPVVPAHPNDPTEVPSYALLDLRAGIESGPWRVQVFGRNVTDKYYWTGAYHVNDILQHYTGMPATYGVTVSYRY